MPVLISVLGSAKTREVYAMLDTQSDTSFILESVANSLRLLGTSTQLRLTTLQGTAVIRSTKYHGLCLRAIDGGTELKLPEVYSRPDLPYDTACIPTSDMLAGIQALEHIRPMIGALRQIPVGLLLGYDCVEAFRPLETIASYRGGPYAQRTCLGWGVIGPTGGQRSEGSMVFMAKTRAKELLLSNKVLSLLEQDFKDVAMNKNTPDLSVDDRAFIELLDRETRVLPNGHLEMPLPLQGREGSLLNNKQAAFRRLLSLKTRLQRDATYKEAYTAFMSGMLQLGHAEPAPSTSEHSWYIPHHGVMHPTKKKLRVVFDCSSQAGGRGLNDVLLQGPDLTNNLIGVLLRFSQERVALMCDVEKMFYQFSVPEKQRDYMRFLWWPEGDLSRDIIEYRMTVHVFGAKSSPAVANYGLKRVAKDRVSRYSARVVDFIHRSFYVDDGLLSVGTAKEAITTVQGSIRMCAEAGLRLCKVTSNNRAVLNAVAAKDRSFDTAVDLTKDDLPDDRALGIKWLVQSDVYQFVVKPFIKAPTRRTILSLVSSVYDPLGLVCPFVLTGRLILRDMCREDKGWDDPVGDSISARWTTWLKDSEDLQTLKIPRCSKPRDFGVTVRRELHSFSDASERGYGAVVYMRSWNRAGAVYTQFLFAKARVASLKHVTIPRLELVAAVLSTALVAKVRQELRLDCSTPTKYYVDSQVVLGYVRSESGRFKTFVANRVQQIRDISQTDEWHFCPGELNPADFASRGLTAAEMLSHSTWHAGPTFPIPQPTTAPLSTDVTDPELRRVLMSSTTGTWTSILNFKAYSSWPRLRKVTAIVIRYTTWLRMKIRSATTLFPATLTVADYEAAETLAVREAQQESFSDEILLLSTGKPVSNHALSKLLPRLDNNNILRVGGRLNDAAMSERERSPFILSRTHVLSVLIVRWAHDSVAHQGRATSINAVRQAGYWVLGLSTLMSAELHRCVTCRKLRGKSTPPLMASLPAERTSPSPPFTYVGTDFFGPILVSERRSKVKRWGVLFTCLYTRAVHIETANELTTDSVISCIRRFKAIRGPIRLLRCDRGSNYTGMVSELTRALSEIEDVKLRAHLRDHGCDLEVQFSPASAPHSGGVWERLVQSTKRILDGMLVAKPLALNDEGLRTLLCEVSAVINARPLTSTAVSDPTSPLPLSPAMLLTGKVRPLLPPPGVFTEDDVTSRKRWRRLQYLVDVFWRRFRVEYLQSLQARTKWTTRTRTHCAGDVVIVRDDGPLRNIWTLGRITEVMPSADGVVRRVRVALADSDALNSDGKRKCSLKTLERPVSKLVVLVPA